MQPADHLAIAPAALRRLQEHAAALRDLHRPGNPLVLANAWDAASARIVADAGFPVMASSSGAVARALGFEDTNSMPVAAAFAAVARIAQVADLPMTADMEAGYGLEAAEFVGRLLRAGAVGCNLEDSDHRGANALVDAAENAARIRAVVGAARAAGVDIVVNARVDVRFGTGDADDEYSEAIRRARLYHAAGATSVYPIFLNDDAIISKFVSEVEAPVNILLRGGTAAEAARYAALGAARVSVGSGLMARTYDSIVTALRALRPS